MKKITVFIGNHSVSYAKDINEATAMLWAYGTLLKPEKVRFYPPKPNSLDGWATNSSIINEGLELKDCPNTKIRWAATALRNKLQPWSESTSFDEATTNLIKFIIKNRKHIIVSSDKDDWFNFLVDDVEAWMN